MTLVFVNNDREYMIQHNETNTIDEKLNKI